MLSEELGDDNVAKNHVTVFIELLKDVRFNLPPNYSKNFVQERHGLSDAEIWELTFDQLLILLLPRSFLPEILGFSMRFELVTMDTLRALTQLTKIGISPCYFILYVTIDNIDSGYSGMALEAVRKYLELIRVSLGEVVTQKACRRVQTRSMLSESLPTTPSKGPTHIPTLVPASRRRIESELIYVFISKARVSRISIAIFASNWELGF